MVINMYITKIRNRSESKTLTRSPAAHWNGGGRTNSCSSNGVGEGFGDKPEVDKDNRDNGGCMKFGKKYGHINMDVTTITNHEMKKRNTIIHKRQHSPVPLRHTEMVEFGSILVVLMEGARILTTNQNMIRTVLTKLAAWSSKTKRKQTKHCYYDGYKTRRRREDDNKPFIVGITHLVTSSKLVFAM